MFAFLKSIKLPFNKKFITCLSIVAVVLAILYFTGFINKEKLPFENYEDAPEEPISLKQKFNEMFPKTTLTCLLIVAIVLVAFYFTVLWI